MSCSWQQCLALDARYNAYRTVNNPQFRTLYMRRRSQLLRNSAQEHPNSTTRKDHLKLRAQLLAVKYGTAISLSDQSSNKSRTASLRSFRQHDYNSGDERWRSSSWRDSPRESPQPIPATPSSPKPTVVPTHAAQASRAMAGGQSLSENYTFNGMAHIFDQHKKAVTQLKFANDEKHRLACSSTDGTLSICSVEAEAPHVTHTLRGHTAPVTDFAWSSSNDVLVSVSADGSLRMWDPNTGKCLRVVQDPSSSAVLCCAFQPLNNNMVVVGTARGTVQVVNISTGKLVKGGQGKCPGAVLCVAVESSGRMLWTGDDKGSICSFLYDLFSARLTRARRVSVCEGWPVTSLSMRSWLSREARDPCLLISWARNSLLLCRITSEDGALQVRRQFPVKHTSKHIRSIFCPLMSFTQGACVVSGSEDCSVYLFDVEREAKQVVNRLQGHSAPVLTVSFNSDECLLASADSQGMLIVWKKRKLRT